MKKKTISLLLCLSMLLSVTLLAACDPSESSDTTPDHASSTDSVASDPDALRVMYIPLDNRPINDQQVRLLAESLRIDLIMPDSGLYATTLDGAVNDAGLQYGDRAAILEWMMAEADSCDTIIVYLDQLLSGGLMNSRCMDSMEAVTLSDGTIYTEFEIIDYIASLAQTHTVYVIDSQLRLASSSGYLGFTSDDYSISRLYGLVSRPSLEDHATVEDVIAGYTLTDNHSEAIYAAGLTQEQIDYYIGSGDHSPLARYLAIRERKFRLNAYAVETLYHLESVRYFFGVDDSANGSNIQSAEFEYLNRLAGGSLEKLSAIDCLGELAVSCIFNDYCGNNQVSVLVRYYGSADNNLNFAGHTVSEAVDQIITFCDAVSVSQDADVEILVACDSSDDDQAQAASDAIISQMKQNFANEIPTIYIDFASKTNSALLTEVDISMLMSAGLHANGSGASAIMGISQGLARYRALMKQSYLTEDCHKAFIEDLVFMFAKGYYWNSGYKYEMSSYLSELGLDANNMTNATAEQLERIGVTLTNKIVACSSNILDSVNGGTYIHSLSPYSEAKVETVTISNCSYPWLRTFEFTADFTVDLR